MKKIKMEKIEWKITAIIFIVLFILMVILLVWAYSISVDEQNKQIECYYNFCNEYPQAWYEDNVCYCYDYDVLGQLQIVETKIMK